MIMINIMDYISDPFLIPHLLVTCYKVVHLESKLIH